MLIRDIEETVTRKVVLRLRVSDAKRLDKIEAFAAEIGKRAVVEEALSASLVRMLGQAERKLKEIQAKAVKD